MGLAGFTFWFWRFFEIVTLIPIVGMLAYFVHAYTHSNTLTPDFILLLFIGSVLAAAWAIATILAYARSRNSGYLVGLIDLGFVGLFIAAVYKLRGIANADCSNFTAGSIYIDLGILGYIGRNSNNPWSLNINKNCAMLKASFAFGIMNCIFFFITAFAAILIGRHHHTDRVVVEKRHSSRHGHRRSSREYYSSSPRRSHHSSRRYVV